MFQLNKENSLQQKQKISVKVEETYKEEGHEENFYKTDVDNFDSLMYEDCLRNSDNKRIYQVEYDTVHCFRFKFSQIFYIIDYREPLGVELFDNLSNVTTFKSRSLGIVISKEYKKLNSKWGSKDLKFDKKQKLEISIIEEASFRLIKKKSSFSGSQNSIVFSGIDCEDEVIVNTSVDNSFKELKNKQSFLRPSYVNNLFNKYGYEELDHLEDEQKKTKNNSLCLFEIKSIYNKICGLFS